LLTKRLRKLEELGIVERKRHEGSWEYQITPAGEELRPIVVGLGHWGARWIGSRLRRDQLDAGFLMWDIRRFCRMDAFPKGRRVVIHFHFTDAPARERLWWLVVENATTDLCRDDPGHELDVIVECTVRALTELWTGDSDSATEMTAGRLKISGAGPDGARLWRWLGRSMFAESRRRA